MDVSYCFYIFNFDCKDTENLCNNQQISYKLSKNIDFCYKIKLYYNKLSEKTHVSRDTEQKKEGQKQQYRNEFDAFALSGRIG